MLSLRDHTHIATREILLKYFDFVSIVELPRSTFNKAKTNTVVLFLRRKSQRPEPAEQYQNRVLDFFENWEEELKSGGGMYLDIDVVRKYCEHIEIDFEDYQSLLLGCPSEQLLEYELFKEYRADFDKSTEIVKLKKKKSFDDLSIYDQGIELNKQFLKYLQAIEKDKLYYFILAFNNPQKLLIVRSPTVDKEEKQFLGYEWKERRGKEGLHYLNDNHVTPLFDPYDRYNTQKINYLIQKNFNNKIENNDLQNASKYITYSSLVNLLDFSRKDFSKVFSLDPKKNITIETKWTLVKLEDICTFEYGKSLPEKKRISGKYPVMGSNGRVGFHNEFIVESPSIIIGRKGSAGKVIWENENCFPIDTTFYVKLKIDDVKLYYLYLVLEYLRLDQLSDKSGVPGLNRNDVYQLKVPLPPLEVQQQIVAECERLEQTKNKFFASNMNAKDFEKLIKDKTNEIIKKYL